MGGQAAQGLSPRAVEGRVPGARQEEQEAGPRPGELDDPRLYISRERSFLQFNLRVLEEALDTRLPLLERVKFLRRIQRRKSDASGA
jgi:hypothetical protein